MLSLSALGALAANVLAPRSRGRLRGRSPALSGRAAGLAVKIRRKNSAFEPAAGHTRQIGGASDLKETAMSYLLSFLRSAALAAAALFLTPTSFVTGTATVASVTAVTVMTSSPAEAERARVRDHRCRWGQISQNCRR
jgi:hypothetical protein